MASKSKAKRPKSKVAAKKPARKVVKLKGASLLFMVSRPKETAKLILEAGQQTLVASVQGS